MGYVEKRHGKYRARYRDASGRQRSKTFTLKADAERFIREEEVALERGSWVDPRVAEMTLAEWWERFMSLARRPADTTQPTYRRDLDRYVLPKFGTYRLGRLRAEEIEEWLLDEIDSGLAPSSVHRHYRTLDRVLEVAVTHKRLATSPCAGVQPPSVPNAAHGHPRLAAGLRPGRRRARRPARPLPSPGLPSSVRSSSRRSATCSANHTSPQAGHSSTGISVTTATRPSRSST